MAFFDSIFSGDSGVAASLINMMGVKAIFRHYPKKEDSDYDPITNSYTTEEVFEEKEVTVSPILQYSTYTKNNSSIEEGDCKILGLGKDFSVFTSLRDTISLNNKTYAIVASSPIYSGDSLAVVSLQVREVKSEDDN